MEVKTDVIRHFTGNCFLVYCIQIEINDSVLKDIAEETDQEGVNGNSFENGECNEPSQELLDIPCGYRVL